MWWIWIRQGGCGGAAHAPAAVQVHLCPLAVQVALVLYVAQAGGGGGRGGGATGGMKSYSTIAERGPTRTSPT